MLSSRLASTRVREGCPEGQSPFAEGLGVSPNPKNSLESPFDKGGLRGFGAGG